MKIVSLTIYSGGYTEIRLDDKQALVQPLRILTNPPRVDLSKFFGDAGIILRTKQHPYAYLKMQAMGGRQHDRLIWELAFPFPS